MTCPPALVRAMRPREIQRLHTRRIATSADARDLLCEVALAPNEDGEEAECVVAIALGRADEVVALTLATAPAGSSHCAFRPAELLGLLFREGDPARMHRVVLAHNHVDGVSTDPNHFDLAITRTLACEFAGLRILDHVIVAGEAHVSLRETNPEAFPEPGCRREAG